MEKHGISPYLAVSLASAAERLGSHEGAGEHEATAPSSTDQPKDQPSEGQGTEPVPGVWPSVVSPTKPGDRRAYPGMGGEIFLDIR